MATKPSRNRTFVVLAAAFVFLVVVTAPSEAGAHVGDEGGVLDKVCGLLPGRVVQALCDRRNEPLVRGNRPSSNEPSALTFDERMAAIAAEVPEFGGMHIDEASNSTFVNVTSRRPGLIGDLRWAIRRQYPDARMPDQIRLNDRPFSFTQLHNWKQKSRNLFAVDGVSSLDIDDQTGLLTIGVSQEGSRGEIAADLAANGIPPAGWTIETVEVPTDAATVDDHHRPVMGGLKINNGSGSCTYGLTAYRQGQLGFLTNSHCTLAKGGTEGTVMAQPSTDPTGANDIGTEAADPSYFTTGCYSGFVCRYSDTSFFRAVPGVTYSRAIVRNPRGSFDHDGTTRYYVVDEDNAFVGYGVRKVGQNSGHTAGTVIEKCSDVASGKPDSRGRPVIYLCQDRTTATVVPGDSGSPVFNFVNCTVNGQPDLCAVVYGLMWTHDSTGGIFSPIGQIQKSSEMGLVYTCVNDNC